MGETVGAILLDTRSIQKYLFSGTKLKTNIGASYIVSHVFDDVLVGQILKKTYRDRLDEDSWKKESGEIKALPQGKDCYVAYIGGGNALILFRETEREKLKKVVQDFTKTLLITYPGLKTGAAIGTIDLDHFQDGLSVLYRLLKEGQNTVFPQVNVVYTGLTLSCPVNGEAANGYDRDGIINGNSRNGRFYSQEVIAKAKKNTEADQALEKTFESYVDFTRFAFPSKLEDLGQKEGEQDIAIIHIDGNNMGKRFREMGTTLQKRSQLAEEIQAKTTYSFGILLRRLERECQDGLYDAFLDCKREDDPSGRRFLPIRPLILGGDDVTFICPGRLALLLARRFMKHMAAKEMVSNGKDPFSISCCGGIAILPAAYPFFRGYELAEQLCSTAKKKSRSDDRSCWLDFAILHGEQAPTLEQIREKEYTGKLGNMHFGPWRVDETAHKPPFHVDFLLDGVEAFSGEDMPRNKVKELRFVLQKGEHAIKLFLEQFRYNDHDIPDIEKWDKYRDAETLWYSTDPSQKGSQKTPYIDVIEMMDYLPLMPVLQELLKDEGSEDKR